MKLINIANFVVSSQAAANKLAAFLNIQTTQVKVKGAKTATLSVTPIKGFLAKAEKLAKKDQDLSAAKAAEKRAARAKALAVIKEKRDNALVTLRKEVKMAIQALSIGRRIQGVFRELRYSLGLNFNEAARLQEVIAPMWANAFDLNKILMQADLLVCGFVS